jgi:hypothetical protein
MEALKFANWRGIRIFDPDKALPADRRDLGKELTFDFVNERALLFGSPYEVPAKLIALHAETGNSQIILVAF